ncbi:MAG: hypothetical protein GY874_01115 [Desulfobacteraceae bacterium]|nr:hypothetical protein [Desulfobacteraceae bacterium]
MKPWSNGAKRRSSLNRTGLGKRNNWRYGSYAQNFLTKIKPCLSSCAKYPCRLADEGATEPGGDCLDAQELLHIIRVVHKALMEPDAQDDFSHRKGWS